MRRTTKFIIFLALFAGSASAFMSVPETRRMVERAFTLPPVQYRLAAWSELEARGLKPGMEVFIRIFKQSSELELWMKGARGWELFRTIAICKWSGRLGPKLKQGDKQAPEGFYTVTRAQLNPNSRHH